MTRFPSLSADFVPYKYERYEESIMPITMMNISNAVQVVDDGFTAVKRTKATKGTPNMPSQFVTKNKQPVIGVRCSSSLFTIVKRVIIK
jgi:hypothetical protein